MTRILNTHYHKPKDVGKNKQKYKAHSLQDITKWLNHNHRVYKNTSGKVNEHFCHSKIDSELSYTNFNITNSETYTEWFNNQVPKEVIEEYNSKHLWEGRKIKNYFEFMSKKSKQALAERLVISLGSKETLSDVNAILKGQPSWINFWSTYTKNLKDELNKLIPDFKIYDLTLHLDETTPHVHIVGTGFKYTPEAKQGLKFRLASASIFTRESLKQQHAELRKFHQGEAQRLTDLMKQENIKVNSSTQKVVQLSQTNNSKDYEPLTFEASQVNLANRER